MSDHLETANGVARSLCICTRKARTCKAVNSLHGF